MGKNATPYHLDDATASSSPLDSVDKVSSNALNIINKKVNIIAASINFKIFLHFCNNAE
jgi:hypothetical protein